MAEPTATTGPSAATSTAEPAAANGGDYLGYGVYADTLWARIARALNKDADGKTHLGDDPLVVGLFGEWGSGKSKLLSLVLARARAQSQRDIAERLLTATSGNPMTVTVPVFFQPWKYEHERHLHVPLAVHIADALKQTWKQLPTDIEKLRRWGQQVGEDAQAFEKKISAAKEAIDKVGDFFSGALGAVKSRAGAVVAGTADVALMSVGAPPLASVARKRLIAATGEHGSLWADDADEESDEADLDARDDTAARKAKPAPAKTAEPAKPPHAAFAHSDDGLGFYRVQRHLQALTRPKLNLKLLETAGIEVTPGIEFDLRINFVVFIDDLDRCLPEKAVEALELIKTVFNLESFAFVLALDEEVVERGIGHRYMAYHLAGKKPDMPITGFEYLEKIVHLPFRLPALSRAQAAAFVQRYEAQIQPDLAQRWFAPPRVEQQHGGMRLDVAATRHEGTMERRAAPRTGELDLLALALNGFDVYVPRKLIRLVELMHQTAAVAQARGRPLGWDGDGAVDVRVVLALVQIQLFQPDLFRLMRRRQGAFPALLAAFAKASADKPSALRSAGLANMDLWRWVACESTQPHATDVLPEDQPRRSPTQPGQDPVISRIQAIEEPATRSLAQQVRLPLVSLLTEYRDAQRHGFNALALMQALAVSLDATGDQPEALNFAPYASLLGEQLVVAATAAAQPGAGAASRSTGTPPPTLDTRPRHTPRDLQKLFDEWTSEQPSIQANLAGNNELPEGAVLGSASAKVLLEKAEALVAGLTTDADVAAAARRLKTGLAYLAPYIAREDGPAFWALADPHIENHEELGLPVTFKDTTAIATRDAWADLRSTLGADPRFDPGFFYLPKERFNGHDETAEPIPGFVRVAADQPFYIARYLTTVDQYAAFVDGQGYDEASQALWDKQGWQWRTGNWDSQVKDRIFQQRLTQRNPTLRGAPVDWAAQRPHGSRPVWGLNWFEARAYVRWLNAQDAFRQGLAGAGLAQYQALLPTEAQWERAARAKDLTGTDAREYPWGGSESQGVHLRANIDDSGIDRASVAGLFAPSPIGLCDVTGNLWEWQDNLYGQAEGSKTLRIAKDAQLRTNEAWEKCDMQPLRGGSWIDRPERARCSYRFRVPPDHWSYDLGFRVVLSLAE
jgi:formylglycine-generating enzyme required for sulfatase activity